MKVPIHDVRPGGGNADADSDDDDGDGDGDGDDDDDDDDGDDDDCSSSFFFLKAGGLRMQQCCRCVSDSDATRLNWVCASDRFVNQLILFHW